MSVCCLIDKVKAIGLRVSLYIDSRAGGNLYTMKHQTTLYSGKNMSPTVYILASKKYGTLYIGVTSNLIKRIWQHKQEITEGFSLKYSVKTLVYFEQHDSMANAILREKQLKKWRRQWKINLINNANPDWVDMWDSIL